MLSAVEETVSATLLRSLPIGAHHRRVKAQWSDFRRGDRDRYRPRGGPLLFGPTPFMAPSAKRGRPVQWTPGRLAEVAQVYKAAWAEGRPPRKAVAEYFVLTLPAAAKLVSRARKAGLLGKTTRGRGGVGTLDKQRKGRADDAE